MRSRRRHKFMHLFQFCGNKHFSLSNWTVHNLLSFTRCKLVSYKILCLTLACQKHPFGKCIIKAWINHVHCVIQNIYLYKTKDKYPGDSENKLLFLESWWKPRQAIGTPHRMLFYKYYIINILKIRMCVYSRLDRASVMQPISELSIVILALYLLK